MIYGDELGLSEIYYGGCSFQTLFNKEGSNMFVQIVDTLGEFSVESVCLEGTLRSGSSEMRRKFTFPQ